MSPRPHSAHDDEPSSDHLRADDTPTRPLTFADLRELKRDIRSDMAAIDRQIEDHARALSDGRVTFNQLTNQLGQVIDGLRRLEAQAAQSAELRGWHAVAAELRGAVIFWAVPVVFGAVLWLIVAAGQVPGARVYQPQHDRQEARP